MKRLKTFLPALMVAVCLCFVACSSDNGSEPSTSDVVGTWVISQVSADNNTYIEWPYERTSATFNADGTYSGSGYFGNGEGTWKKKGDTIITYIDDEEYVEYEVLSMTSSTCTLKMSVSGSSLQLYLKCIKK